MKRNKRTRRLLLDPHSMEEMQNKYPFAARGRIRAAWYVPIFSMMILVGLVAMLSYVLAAILADQMDLVVDAVVPAFFVVLVGAVGFGVCLPILLKLEREKTAWNREHQSKQHFPPMMPHTLLPPAQPQVTFEAEDTTNHGKHS